MRKQRTTLFLDSLVLYPFYRIDNSVSSLSATEIEWWKHLVPPEVLVWIQIRFSVSSYHLFVTIVWIIPPLQLILLLVVWFLQQPLWLPLLRDVFVLLRSILDIHDLVVRVSELLRIFGFSVTKMKRKIERNNKKRKHE
jgi:hypothetical protein